MDKKVTFQNRVKVKYFKQTSIESNVCWQQVARDRVRFKKRILEIEQSITWIFNRKHREQIYTLRYTSTD